MTDTQRVPCVNADGGRASFRITRTSAGARIETPETLTRTAWRRDQLAALRDALTDILSLPTRGGIRR